RREAALPSCAAAARRRCSTEDATTDDESVGESVRYVNALPLAIVLNCMRSFARDLRYAVRTLVRMRGVAIVAILTLALGTAGTTTMFSVVYATLLRQPPFPGAERLVILFNTS